jgi:hypothetical protein
MEHYRRRVALEALSIGYIVIVNPTAKFERRA